MSTSRIHIEGIGFWGSGLPGWEHACALLADGCEPAEAPRKPAPTLLAPNERRRAPDTVALALQVAQAACAAAGRDPAGLPSVFTSTHGDLAITDYMCATLASDPRALSPTRFHNSVHNAAAGYWTIGNGCMAPATAISAYQGSFAQGLVEAAAQVHAGEGPVLLVAYDAQAQGPLGEMSRSEGLLAVAMVLSDEATTDRPALSLQLRPGQAAAATGALATRFAGNAMAPMLPLLELLAAGGPGRCELPAGPAGVLEIEVAS